jgi:hypothetical protein
MILTSTSPDPIWIRDESLTIIRQQHASIAREHAARAPGARA